MRRYIHGARGAGITAALLIAVTTSLNGCGGRSGALPPGYAPHAAATIAPSSSHNRRTQEEFFFDGPPDLCSDPQYDFYKPPLCYIGDPVTVDVVYIPAPPIGPNNRPMTGDEQACVNSGGTFITYPGGVPVCFSRGINATRYVNTDWGIYRVEIFATGGGKVHYPGLLDWITASFNKGVAFNTDGSFNTYN